MINEAMQAFAFAPENESQLTNSADVHKAIRELKFGQKKKRSERCKEHGSEMSNRGSEQIFSQKLNTLLHRISHQLGNVLA